MTVKDPATTDDVVVKVEGDTEQPATTETEGVAEGTAQNESTKPESQVEKRSAGNVIADLGNEKKAIAGSLVKLAKSSESAREEAKKILAEDPSMAGYMKSKFGEDYSLIMGDTPVAKNDKVDIEKIREEERVKAQADVIKTQLQTAKDKMIEDKAKELGLTTSEFELFKRKVEILGGDEQALSDAALIVNKDKANARDSFVGAPSGGEAEKPSTREVTITKGLNAFAEDHGIDRTKFATELDRVKSMHKLDAHGKPVMALPGL